MANFRCVVWRIESVIRRWSYIEWVFFGGCEGALMVP